MQLMNVHDLKNSLNLLCEYLNRLYDINKGGCCYVAYLIAYHLDKLKIKYDLIIYDFLKLDELFINNEIIHKKFPNSVSGKRTCTHYCISIIGGGIVNEGDSSDLNKYVVKNITSKHIKWIYKNGYWNKQYDCNYSKCVKGMIDSFFLEYKLNKF